ncbi:cyclic nucleotide-binding domain-containing protein [Leptospira licerasiae]|uniref:Transporter, cation channel family / cyclic nucleotide-binding domain multi-domain protein n=2 Tax=Leptospira licerasiae TaxID=447106 RepID=A0ABF7PI38_9LEPT|nr:cyclic nucleotide-binding domain-containing protein [Leptospira licerasiae]EIE02967.1 transporter, cation channel family / cyclic nucleotide-binding domain multi-domain protein [Leptospira licerasiae serovar Varillal str. VAR 010]EJZ41376.1 transporter, cation channel family protein [Leptospira licerasiae str. MMD4847]
MITLKNRIRVYWDILVFICIFWASLESPLRIVINYDPNLLLTCIYFFIDFVFALDILWNCFTPEYKDGKWILTRSQVIKDYLGSWFIIDLIAALPLEYATTTIFGLQQSQYPYLYLLLGVTRILKVFRISDILQRINLAFQPTPGILRLVLFAFWATLVAHWCAVGWLYVDDLLDYQTGWSEYIIALYWTVATIATVGYGDITPSTDSQRIYTIFVMILGAGVYATVIGNIASILGSLDLAKAAQRKKMAQVDSFLKARNISQNIRRRVRDYYMYIIDRGWGEDENALLNDLPISLRREVKIQLHRDLLEKVPFLKGADPALVTSLVFSMKPMIFLEGDTIFRRGEKGDDLYILSEGSVDILDSDEKTILLSLQEGQFFGELALVMDAPRSATVRATTTCEIYTLSKTDFDNVLKRFSQFRSAIEESVAHLKKR